MLEYILDRLGHGRRALISHYLVPKLLLVIKTINHVEEEVIVFDTEHLLEKTQLINQIKDNIVITDTIVNIPRDKHVVFLEPNRLPWRIINRNILVTLTPGTYKFKLPDYYDRIYLNKLSENLYELYIKDSMERLRFRIMGEEIVFEEKPSGILGKAYELLREALMEYGEIRVRDAINILVHELSVSKEKAREILSKLVVEKYARIEKGRVIVY